MELKKTVKYDGKFKGLHIVDGKCMTQDDEIIDLVALLEKAYGSNDFDLSTTTKTEEIIDIDEEFNSDFDM